MLFGLWRLHCPLAEQCWVNVSNCSEELVVSWLDYILLYCNNQVIVPSLVYFLWCYILPAVGTSVWSRSTLCFKYTVAFSWQCWISVKKRFHSLQSSSHWVRLWVIVTVPSSTAVLIKVAKTPAKSRAWWRYVGGSADVLHCHFLPPL